MNGHDLILDRDLLRALLTELGERLVGAGISADVYVVGGAAIALTIDNRRTTHDIDAAFTPADSVRAVAAELAAERGLPPAWLNSAAMAFAPAGPDEDAVGLDVPGLSVTVASPGHLLAMKLAAGRERDMADLVVLFETLRITRAEQALDIARTLYGPDSVVLSDPDESYLWLAEDVLAVIRGRRAGA